MKFSPSDKRQKRSWTPFRLPPLESSPGPSRGDLVSSHWVMTSHVMMNTFTPKSRQTIMEAMELLPSIWCSLSQTPNKEWAGRWRGLLWQQWQLSMLWFLMQNLGCKMINLLPLLPTQWWSIWGYPCLLPSTSDLMGSLDFVEDGEDNVQNFWWTLEQLAH